MTKIQLNNSIIIQYGYDEAAYAKWTTVTLPISYTSNYAVSGNTMFIYVATETGIYPNKTLSNFQWAGAFRNEATGTSCQFNWITVGF